MAGDGVGARVPLVPPLDVLFDGLSGGIVGGVVAETALEDDLLQVMNGRVGLDVEH